MCDITGRTAMKGQEEEEEEEEEGGSVLLLSKIEKQEKAVVVAREKQTMATTNLFSFGPKFPASSHQHQSAQVPNPFSPQQQHTQTSNPFSPQQHSTQTSNPFSQQQLEVRNEEEEEENRVREELKEKSFQVFLGVNYTPSFFLFLSFLHFFSLFCVSFLSRIHTTSS